ncbi:MAG: tRNA-dihydrouridine synthase [Methanobacteriaceae archaeon]|nr:tRNA-dihydrouridine synthase [Methanobacteriaceae archaeon]
MAGINDGAFCRNLSVAGFDMVTLGGYNADFPTIQAGHQILSRGRPEFVVEEENLLSYLEDQVKLIKEPGWEGIVSINLRAITPDPLIEISKIGGVDVVEINAHCRQKEITDLGCGQTMLRDPVLLEEFTRDVTKNSKSRVSVKIRANVPGADEVEVAKVIEQSGADYIHIDAMKPGFNSADYQIISSVKENTSIFLIGNNSIKDVTSGLKMLAAGADGISIARAAMGGSLNFDLSLI